jgi:hypothetical protein
VTPPKSKGCYLSTLELHELDEACAPFLSALARAAKAHTEPDREQFYG